MNPREKLNLPPGWRSIWLFEYRSKRYSNDLDTDDGSTRGAGLAKAALAAAIV